MTSGSDTAETVLIVDDEEPVRKTFREWLEGARFGCRILTAADAESALRQANENVIDLAILDWNLGAGNDGLQLLEDLVLFNPDVVAILITGFAHQATPLAAMRMGVRDYLDKNQDLDRDTFLNAVRRQLERIRPARRERRIHQGLVVFRSAVEKVLPLVQAAAALNDPVPLPAAISNLFRFLLRTTAAADGVLLIRSYDADRQPAEVCRVYDVEGRQRDDVLVPFARSAAGSVLSLQEPSVMGALEEVARSAALQLQPFERGRRSLLAAPMNVAPGLQAVFELFDKRGPSGPAFTEADRRVAAAAADFGAEMLRQALAERQTHQVLFDAVAAALGASENVAEALRGPAARPDEPPPPDVLRQLQQGLAAGPEAAIEAGDTLRLAEAVRELAVRHGPSAVRHCIALVESVRALLDETAGLSAGGRETRL
jgi:ActR/RegA family two-component response regulator